VREFGYRPIGGTNQRRKTAIAIWLALYFFENKHNSFKTISLCGSIDKTNNNYIHTLYQHDISAGLQLAYDAEEYTIADVTHAYTFHGAS